MALQNVADLGTYNMFFREKPIPCMGIRFPSFRATPFPLIQGRRAREVFDIVTNFMQRYGLSHKDIDLEGEKIVVLPLFLGLASTVFLLAVYGKIRPSKYAWILEKLAAGEVDDLSKLVRLTELAAEFSTRSDEKMTVNEATKIFSRLMTDSFSRCCR